MARLAAARRIGYHPATGMQSVGRSGSQRSSLNWLVGPTEIEFDAEQHDAVLCDELPDDHGCRDERATDDQDPVVGTVGVRNWEGVEVLGELIDDCRQVDDDEVGTGRVAVRPSVAAELAVEIIEERLVDTNGAATRQRSDWLAAMCASILRRVRSRSSGDTLERSVSNPARTIDCRSLGLIFSSSSADQVFDASMATRYQAARAAPATATWTIAPPID